MAEKRKRGRPVSKEGTVVISVRVSKDLVERAFLPSASPATNIERCMRSVIMHEKPSLENLKAVERSLIEQMAPIKRELQTVMSMIMALEDEHERED